MFGHDWNASLEVRVNRAASGTEIYFFHFIII